MTTEVIFMPISIVNDPGMFSINLCIRFEMETNRCLDRRQSTTTILISRTTICRLFRVLSPDTQWDRRKVNFASSPVTVTVNLDLSSNHSRQK
ncbi:hypothetical protein NPIL_35221 [Nephila pilipes]|uniref:Uncharacterized protein n=1 Tax=Nephila pilipes TaxID=299642 RepID=A0A8X6NAQ5_NEPPI|nr:hypothetical protein NPIL_35221 [Nephila pilipes]